MTDDILRDISDGLAKRARAAIDQAATEDGFQQFADTVLSMALRIVAEEINAALMRKEMHSGRNLNRMD